MRIIRIGGVLALYMGAIGCSGTVSRAEEEHRIAMAEAVTDEEKCAIEAKLAKAYLSARDEEKYRSQKLRADIECLSIQTNRGTGGFGEMSEAAQAEMDRLDQIAADAVNGTLAK